MGGKYAVCVGVNYTKNPEAALKGCHNDAGIWKNILLGKGFDESNIKVLLDDGDSSSEDPTGVNVKKALNWLCDGRSKDDTIFFSFSGHGSQIPCDGDDHEADSKDEVIVLESLFLLADDDLKQFFVKLPKGCRVTVVTDCCHSSGLLDHVEILIQGDKKDDTSGVAPSGSADDSLPRSLPASTISSILSSKLGTAISPGLIRKAQAQIFGGDASKMAMKFAMSQMSGKGGAGGNPLAALMGGGGGGGGGAGGVAGAGMAALGKVMGGGGSGATNGVADKGNPLSMIASLLSELGLGGSESVTAAGAPAYHAPGSKIDDDVGILITGCQSTETSADVRPPGGGAYGALTNAMKTALEKNPDVSYYDLVIQVRSLLKQGGYSQNPCLEGSVANSKLPFICSTNEEGATRTLNQKDETKLPVATPAATVPPVVANATPASTQVAAASAAQTTADTGDAATGGILKKLMSMCFK